MKHNLQQQSPWKRSVVQLFFGRPEDPAFYRASRVAASVVLILLLGCAIRPLAELAGLAPEEFPFSWSGAGEEMLVKPAGAFLVVLFLHLLRWLIRARRRGLAMTLVAATGPLSFCAGLMSFGPAQVFSRDALTSEAVVAWLMLLVVPVIFFGVVTQLETKWLRTHDRNA
jgi:hypothetical protein